MTSYVESEVEHAIFQINQQATRGEGGGLRSVSQTRIRALYTAGESLAGHTINTLAVMKELYTSMERECAALERKREEVPSGSV